MTDARSDDEHAGQVAAAIAADRVAIVLQPVVSAATRTPVFYECLLRMRDASGADMSVAEFIPAVERLGLQGSVDRQVLDRSFALLERAPSLNLSINVSALTVGDAAWFRQAQSLLTANKLAASRLIVEITETAAIDDTSNARSFVEALQQLGARVAIDDFGAGHTSLPALEALRPDIVKLDGSYIAGKGGGRIDRVFVSHVVRVAEAMAMQTVAEWVSDEASAAILCDLGVDLLQGEAFGLPQPWSQWTAA